MTMQKIKRRAWRKQTCQGCRHKYYDAQRPPEAKGNPLCGMFLAGTRCAFGVCPLRKK